MGWLAHRGIGVGVGVGLVLDTPLRAAEDSSDSEHSESSPRKIFDRADIRLLLLLMLLLLLLFGCCLLR